VKGFCTRREDIGDGGEVVEKVLRRWR